MSAVGAGEKVVPASVYRVLQRQVRELQQLLGKKTPENEILRETLDLAQPKKLLRSSSPAPSGRDRGDHRRHAGRWLSTRACADPAWHAQEGGAAVNERKC